MVLPENVRKENNFTSFEIMYKKEIKYNENVRCFVAEEEKGYTIAFKNEDLTQVYAIIKLYK